MAKTSKGYLLDLLGHYGNIEVDGETLPDASRLEIGDGLSATYDRGKIILTATPVEAPVEADTYTPTLTTVAGLEGATLNRASFMRIGNEVRVDIDVSVELDDGEVDARELRVSLPFAGSFSSTWDLHGHGEVEEPGLALITGASATPAVVSADTSNNAAYITWNHLASEVTRRLRASFVYTRSA